MGEEGEEGRREREGEMRKGVGRKREGGREKGGRGREREGCKNCFEPGETKNRTGADIAHV